MRPGEALESLSRDQLLELIAIYSKNWLAMDGVWFQSVERKYGMEEAMYHDVEAWRAWPKRCNTGFMPTSAAMSSPSKTADCCTVCWNALFSKRAPERVWACIPASLLDWLSTPGLPKP